LNQLADQGREPVSLPLAIAIVEDDGLPFHIAEVAHPLLEGRETGRGPLLGRWFQHSNPGDFPKRLRCRGVRYREQVQGECHEKPDGAVPH